MLPNMATSFFTTSLQLFPFVMFIVYLVNIIVYKFSQVRKHSGQLGPPTYPVLGCLVSFYKNRRRLLAWYTELLTESATSTIVVQRLGARRTIVTANPENVEYMLKTNFNNFPKGKPFTEILGDFLGYGIFNVDGEMWRTQRKLASHEFTANSLREFLINTLEEEVGKGLIPVLESLAEKEEVFDLQDLLRRVAFNIIRQVSLGVERSSLHPSSPVPPLASAFDVASNISAMRGAAPLFVVWKIKRWLQVGSERRLHHSVQQIHRYVTEIIDNKKRAVQNNENNNEDLLSRFIRAGYDDVVIRDMVISFIMAGRDTTSAAMTWLFWLLSSNQQVEKQVVKEATSVIEQHLDYDSLKELKLLKACLCESMRLYPPVAWDSKHALTDDLLPDNTPVRAGDRVTYFPYGMGRMEAVWGPEWSKFKPERWFVDVNEHENGPKNTRELKKESPFMFPIFQAGPRVCLGKEMAFIQMRYIVASILSQFEIRPVRTENPVFVPLLTAHMAGGLKVLIRKRTH